MIVSIEGIDGAGKNTLVSALTQVIDAKVLAFPRYETSIHAQLAAEALHGRMGDLTDSAYAMATLFALDRHFAIDDLNAPGVVLLDRYVASNAAYTAARLLDDDAPRWVADLEFGRLKLPRPTLQVLLDTPAEVAQDRARRREAIDSSRARDRYESDSALQERTAEYYRRLSAENWISPWMVVAPDEDPSRVAQRIVEFLGTIN
ncbi:thymidylate kinase [Corynebacterium suranareeae]|uniref:Thymidylate kinase n=1 Tax=Corynebacterium suranareeae TaxID=2506452 RepID=A0A161JM19_9CORY|nr:dTMP kinase [Corynebacterium suranareeae]BAU95138.1 thymidylate kinase [Corynebacterium suranareeae]